MAYEVTANRRRPQRFGDMAGQEFVVATLTSAIESGRIAHAYLFSGPRGVGKTSSARILAKSLNCQQGPTPSPCGECANCKEITAGSSLDVIEIDGASNTSVNDIREIKDEVLFSPNSSRYKIYIIDEVHMLSNSAFNALLKTIEEPPEYIIFIFATTEIHKVPATIRSRCQQFNFRLFTTEDIKNLLVEASNELEITYEEDALFWIAKEATGSMRDSYTLFDQVVSFSDGNITLEKIRDKLGLVGLENMNEIVNAMAESNASEVLSQCDYILGAGVAVEQFIIDLAEYFRNLLFLKYGIHKESLLGYSPDRFSQKALEVFTVSQLEHGVDLIFQLYKDIKYSVNPRFELELLLSRLSSLSAYLSSGDMLDQINRIKTMIGNGVPLSSGEKKKSEPVISVQQTPSAAPPQMEAPGEPTSAAEAFFTKFKTGRKAQAASPSAVSKEENPVQGENVKKEGGPPVFNPHRKAETPASGVESPSETQKSPEEPPVKEEISETASPSVPVPAGSVNLQDLKINLIKKLKKSQITLASTLEKADNWFYDGGVVKLYYKNRFESAMVEREKLNILAEIKSLEPGVSGLEICQTEDEKKDDGPVKDEQIDKILSMFRGQII